MSVKDYYQILGVDKGVNDAEVKKAYRELAQQWHPDKHQNDTKSEAEEKFKDISEAYSVLSDTEKRRNYDATGSPDGRGPLGSQHSGFRTTGDPLEMFFRQQFGGFSNPVGPRLPPAMRGQTIQQIIEISLKESLFGSERKITYEVVSACEICRGRGATKFETCSACKGQGGISQRIGNMMMRQVCSECVGDGQKPVEFCNVCEGKGMITQHKTLNVSIPVSVSNGVTLRLSGQGGRGFNGGLDGDVLLSIDVKYPDLSILSDNERMQLGKLLSK